VCVCVLGMHVVNVYSLRKERRVYTWLFVAPPTCSFFEQGKSLWNKAIIPLSPSLSESVLARTRALFPAKDATDSKLETHVSSGVELGQGHRFEEATNRRFELHGVREIRSFFNAPLHVSLERGA